MGTAPREGFSSKVRMNPKRLWQGSTGTTLVLAQAFPPATWSEPDRKYSPSHFLRGVYAPITLQSKMTTAGRLDLVPFSCLVRNHIVFL